MSGSLIQQGTFELEDDDGSRRFSIDRDTGAISGSGILHQVGAATFGGTLNTTGAVSAGGSVTAVGSFIIGSADLNEADMEKLDGITNGTAAASKAMVTDASNNIASLGTLGCGQITSTGTVTAVGSFIIGSADLNEADMEKLDGITNGTGAANKALVLDASRDVDTINALGIASMANDWTNAGRTVADMGIVTTMDLNGGSIDGTVIGATGVAAGSFAALVGTTATFSSTLTANGDVDLGNATTDSVTVTGRFDSDLLPIADSASDLGSSALQWAELHVDTGYIDILDASDTALDVSADSFYFRDADGTLKRDTMADYAAALVNSEPGFASTGGKIQFDPNSLAAASVASGDSLVLVDADDSNIPKKETVDDLATLFAGVGLSAASAVMALDLNELTGAAVDVAADSIAIVDANDSNASRKESIADLVAAMAGAGLSASAGVLSAQGSGDSISVALVANSGTLAAGLNYTATQVGAIAVALPAVAAAQDGDIVTLKANSGTSPTNKITVSCDTGDKIDGVTNGTVILESVDSALQFIYVHATTQLGTRIIYL